MPANETHKAEKDIRPESTRVLLLSNINMQTVKWKTYILKALADTYAIAEKTKTWRKIGTCYIINGII